MISRACRPLDPLVGQFQGSRPAPQPRASTRIPNGASAESRIEPETTCPDDLSCHAGHWVRAARRGPGGVVMRREVRALGVVIAVVLPVLLAVVLVPSIASAATQTWTPDRDRGAAGPASLGPRVVGVGAAASVEITRDSLDWRNQAPAGPPGLREGPGLAFSSFDNGSVLFGGWG